MTPLCRIRIVDAIHSVLYAAGWSTGDLRADVNGQPVWQVHAHRGEHQIVARAPSQALAWLHAWRMARRLGLMSASY